MSVFARLAQNLVMVAVGYMLWIVGLIASNVGTVLFFVIAYRRGLGWLLACILWPLLLIAWPLLLIAEFKRAIWPVLITLLGCAASCYGASLAHIPL